MKRFACLIFLIFFPAVLHAADSDLDRPHWSLEFKGGYFIPDIENWATAYDSRNTSQFEGSFAYKLTRQIEAGIAGGRIRDAGQGLLLQHSANAGSNVFGGNVTYEAYPLNVFILARGIFTEGQWIVPYAGGGWTRMYYRQEVKDQNVVRGAVDGYHARAGLQFLLDGLDQDAANNFYRDFGVYHTFLILEAEYTHAMLDTTSGSVNLGGTSWFGGLLFEF